MRSTDWTKLTITLSFLHFFLVNSIYILHSHPPTWCLWTNICSVEYPPKTYSWSQEANFNEWNSWHTQSTLYSHGSTPLSIHSFTGTPSSNYGIKELGSVKESSSVYTCAFFFTFLDFDCGCFSITAIEIHFQHCTYLLLLHKTTLARSVCNQFFFWDGFGEVWRDL